MDAARKLKIALDETRTLILGAQVLLGFQMRSAFQDAFEQIPLSSKTWDTVGLLMMVAVLGLLIAPAAHHRIADEGNATDRTMQIIGLAMSGALLLFAVAFGINIYIGLERVFGFAGALAAGLGGTTTALVFWFGIEGAALLHKGSKGLTMSDQPIPLDKKIDQMLTEARVILPGAQALLGFQLAVILTDAFEKLPGSTKAIHAIALGFVALCTILLVTPAAYHRIVYGGEESNDFLRLGSKFILAATVALALGLSADVYVVIAKIAGSETPGVSAAALSLLALVGLWHASPWFIHARRKRTESLVSAR
jgi:uncharacterized PurR-regulated membrane protein YhhQ (DUF165 family)